MKRLLVIVFAAVMIMTFAACGESSEFGVRINEDLNVEIIAENADADMTGAAGTFTVNEGEAVIAEPDFTEGTVLVEFIPFDGSDEDADLEELEASSDPVFEAELSGGDPVECDVPAGEYVVKASAVEAATGAAIIRTESK